MRTFRSFVAVMALALVLPVTLAAQIPDSFTNLEILPEDISKGELLDTMKGFTRALGVRCTHCHVGEEGQPLSSYDFASDEQHAKQTARTMMRMVDQINVDFINKLADQEKVGGKANAVQCVTCHRGFAEPETMGQRLRTEMETGGVEEALATFKSLRQEYYGAGAYDFRPRVLNSLAAEYAQRGDLQVAASLLEANAGFYPDADGIALLQGLVSLQMADTVAAIAALERAVALNPANHPAKSQLQILKKE